MSTSVATRSRVVKDAPRSAGGVELLGDLNQTTVTRRNTILSMNHDQIHISL